MKRVLFVGSFKDAPDGSTGGQMFACKTLINSSVNQTINFILIDTTSISVPPPPIIQRLPYVLFRLFRFAYHLVFSNIDKALIFTADGTSFMEKGLMALMAKMVGKEVILAPRSGMLKDDIEKGGGLMRFIKHVFTKCDIVICQSKIWKKEFLQLVNNKNPEKFIVQPNWIDESQYSDNTLSYETKLHSDTINIIYIGWLESFKGIIDFINAISQLSPANKNIHVGIYGDGSLAEQAAQLIVQRKLSDYVKLEGWANPEMKLCVLRKADIYVLPSHREGFPNALLEAMISELPVIATDVGAIPDIITSGQNGLIVPSEDEVTLATNISTLIEQPDLRLKLAKNAKKTVLECYTTAKALTNFRKILEA